MKASVSSESSNSLSTPLPMGLELEPEDSLPSASFQTVHSTGNTPSAPDEGEVKPPPDGVDATRKSSSSEFTVSSSKGAFRRAGYISIRAEKDRPFGTVGIRMREDAQGCYITGIDANGLLSSSPLEPGDRVLSMNHKRCETLAKALAILREPSPSFSIVVETGEDFQYVQAMVTKSHPAEATGMDLSNLERGHPGLRISSIQKNSKFFNSALNAGDRILAVNEHFVENMSAATVDTLIRDCPREVSILAKTLPATWEVVSEYTRNAEISRRRAAHFVRAARAREDAPNKRKNPFKLIQGVIAAIPALVDVLQSA